MQNPRCCIFANSLRCEGKGGRVVESGAWRKEPKLSRHHLKRKKERKKKGTHGEGERPTRDTMAQSRRERETKSADSTRSEPEPEAEPEHEDKTRFSIRILSRHHHRTDWANMGLRECTYLLATQSADGWVEGLLFMPLLSWARAIGATSAPELRLASEHACNARDSIE